LDTGAGSGTENDPWNATPNRRTVSLTHPGTTATATLPNHKFSNGGIVDIAGAGDQYYVGLFTITVVDQNTFTYIMGGTPTIATSALCPLLPLPFDSIMTNQASASEAAIHLGGGILETNGFDGTNGYYVKPNWKILGTGMEVTILTFDEEK